MTEDQKRQLERTLWAIADELRGNMNADEFRDYILGFIFYKYLSEKMLLKANEVLEPDDIRYVDIDESTKQGKEILAAVKEETVSSLGFFLKPSELFSQVAARGNAKEDEGESTFILEDLETILTTGQSHVDLVSVQGLH